MPLVTVTLRAGRTTAFKDAVLRGVHGALVAAGVPENDRFQRVLELPNEDFRFDPRYPDAASPRGEDFVRVEVLWSVGRRVNVRRQTVAGIVRALHADPGVDPEHVMVVFKETQWENWSFAGGRLLHAGGVTASRQRRPRAGADAAARQAHPLPKTPVAALPGIDETPFAASRPSARACCPAARGGGRSPPRRAGR